MRGNFVNIVSALGRCELQTHPPTELPLCRVLGVLVVVTPTRAPAGEPIDRVGNVGGPEGASGAVGGLSIPPFGRERRLDYHPDTKGK